MASSERILFLSTTGSPIGGVQTWLDNSCVYLAQHRFDPIVGLVRGQKSNDPGQFRQFHPNLNDIEIDGQGLDREGRIRALGRCIRRVNPKIVIPLGVLDGNEACIRAKRSGADLRLIGRAQGNLPPMLADLEDYRDHFDQVVCPGALTRQYLIERAGFSENRVRHIPNGADVATTPRIIREPGEPLRLGYVGRMTRNDKRVLDLIPLCAELKRRGSRVQLIVVGDGPSRSELESGLEPFRDFVAVDDSKRHDELYSEVFPNLDCLLLLSSSETFGIVLAEAMMNGVVPVTSEYIGFQSERLVVDGVHGLSFPVGDVVSAVDAIESLVETPEAWKTAIGSGTLPRDIELFLGPLSVAVEILSGRRPSSLPSPI